MLEPQVLPEQLIVYCKSVVLNTYLTSCKAIIKAFVSCEDSPSLFPLRGFWAKPSFLGHKQLSFLIVGMCEGVCIHVWVRGVGENGTYVILPFLRIKN